LYSMRKDKEQAVKLRRSGKSYRDIQAQLQIPMSTLSDWFRDVDWSRDLARELASRARPQHEARLLELSRTRGERLERAYREARDEAHKEFDALKYNPLFIAGMMLYWSEGTKSPKTGAKLANTDPDMMRLYVHFLREVCRIPSLSIKATVMVYPDLDEMFCRAYWSKKADIPWENFAKSVSLRERRGARRLNWGICAVTVPGTYFKQKVLTWLELLPHALMDRAYYENIAESAGMV
jgi:hypothetical protein